jgi:uncharacterized delta-60 repeat protein
MRARHPLTVLITVTVTLALLARAAEPGHAQQAPSDLDPTFGGGSRVTTDLGGVDVIYDLAIMADGSIVVAGQTERAGAFDVTLARYDRSGSLVTGFGDGGMVVDDLGSADAAYAISVDDEDRILIAGVAGADFALVRYTPEGRRDESFGAGGLVTMPLNTPDSGRYAVGTQNDGKILVAGTVGFALVRFNSDGSLDTGFGEGGTVPPDPESRPNTALAILSSGIGEFVQVVTITGRTYAVAQYTLAGGLDPSFGNGGRVVRANLEGGLDVVNGIFLQVGGKMVVVGIASRSFAVARYNGNFSIDTTFGSGGVLATNTGPGALDAFAVIVEVDGRILLVGSAGGDFALARYQGAAAGDVLYANDFNDPAAVLLPYPTEASPGHRYGYAGGEYQIAKFDPEEDSRLITLPGRYSNAVIAADLRLVGDTAQRYVRLFCRLGDSGSYNLVINTNDGSYQLLVDGAAAADVRTLANGNSPAIKRGNESNRLELICAGDVIIARVNNVQVAAVQDSTLTHGQVAIEVGRFAGAPPLVADLRFDNLVITRAAERIELPATPQPTATPAMMGRPAPGTVLLADNFDDPPNGRLDAVSTDPANSSLAYLGGEYVIQDLTSQRLASSDLPGEYDDVSLAVDVRLVGQSEDRYIAFGCRLTDSGHYRLVLDPFNRTVRIVRWDDAGPTILVRDTQSNAINPDNQRNRVEFICAGATLTARVNGVAVATVSDSSFRSGALYIGVDSYANTLGTSEARFDNLVVTQQ